MCSTARSTAVMSPWNLRCPGMKTMRPTRSFRPSGWGFEVGVRRGDSNRVGIQRCKRKGTGAKAPVSFRKRHDATRCARHRLEVS